MILPFSCDVIGCLEGEGSGKGLLRWALALTPPRMKLHGIAGAQPMRAPKKSRLSPPNTYLGISPPEHVHDALPPRVEGSDDGVGERLPAPFLGAGGAGGANGQHRVEEQHPLLAPLQHWMRARGVRTSAACAWVASL